MSEEHSDSNEKKKPVESKNCRVLIVDDALTMRTVLTASLEAEGYETVAVESGQEALDLFDKEGADFVILDVKMKDMTGLEALDEFRKRRDRMELPIIMATGSPDEEDVVRAFELGANDYIRKPVKFPILFARMDTQLQLKQAIDRIRKELDRPIDV